MSTPWGPSPFLLKSADSQTDRKAIGITQTLLYFTKGASIPFIIHHVHRKPMRVNMVNLRLTHCNDNLQRSLFWCSYHAYGCLQFTRRDRITLYGFSHVRKSSNLPAGTVVQFFSRKTGIELLRSILDLCKLVQVCRFETLTVVCLKTIPRWSLIVYLSRSKTNRFVSLWCKWTRCHASGLVQTCASVSLQNFAFNLLVNDTWVETGTLSDD